MQFLHKCPGLVLSAIYGLLQGFDDIRFFVFLFGFLGKDERIDPLDGCLYRCDVFDGGGRGNGLMVIEGCGGVIVNIDTIPGDIISTDVEIIDDILFHGMFSESWRT